MPFDEVGVAKVASGGRVYLSTAGAHEGMSFTVATNENGAVLLSPAGRPPVRPSTAELAEYLEVVRRGRTMGAEIAALTHERGKAAADLLRTLLVDPNLTETDRMLIIGAALGELDRSE